MQYANSRLSLKLETFEAIIMEIKSSKSKQAGGTLYGYDDGICITVNQISINENHFEYLESERINKLQTNDLTTQYIGEWFYQAGFKGWICDNYKEIMQNKSVAASKEQECKSPVVVGFNIVNGEIIAVAQQYKRGGFSYEDFKSLIDEHYENMMRKKSVLSLKVQDNKSPTENQLALQFPLDIVVKSQKGLEYFNNGIKLVKSNLNKKT
jgi:hypothetical protein